MLGRLFRRAMLVRAIMLALRDAVGVDRCAVMVRVNVLALGLVVASKRHQGMPEVGVFLFGTTLDGLELNAILMRVKFGVLAVTLFRLRLAFCLGRFGALRLRHLRQLAILAGAQTAEEPSLCLSIVVSSSEDSPRMSDYRRQKASSDGRHYLRPRRRNRQI